MPKKTLIITAIIVAVIAVGATATYITQRQEVGKMKEQPVVAIPKNPEKPPAPELPEKPPVQPSEAPSIPKPVQPEEPTTTKPIDTSDWKTYRDENIGFEIKYPPEYILTPESYDYPTYHERLFFYKESLINIRKGREEGGMLEVSAVPTNRESVKELILPSDEATFTYLKVGNYDAIKVKKGREILVLFLLKII